MTETTKQELKAFSVQADEYGCIVFAKSGIVARRQGANELDTEFSLIESCRRVPALDKYAGVKGGVPWKVLVEEHDWSQECQYCCRRVSNDEPDRVWNDTGSQVYCDVECQARQEDVERTWTAEALAKSSNQRNKEAV
ncbi:hypothetical protein [Ewingella americana]|uniref:hypothetical protein n=1 Tax=Ewingella americana TaxID=41202 RepID=UPI00189F804E|nr:hypothetical protein [Ewingella americana]